MFVKICGTTSEEDALLSVALGADALGFIFTASPRQVTAERVSDIVKRLPPEVMTVGVFRNETTSRILDFVMKSGVRGVQLHGMEGPEVVEELRSKLPLFIIKAFGASNPGLRKANEFRADAVLIDAPSPGSGQVFDWRLAEGVPDRERVILAGGLTADNVGEAIETVHPWGVDVVTGVEASRGVKDPAKLRAFITNAKAAFEKTEQRPSHDGDSALYDWREEDWQGI